MEWDGINRRRFIRRKFPYTVHLYREKEEPLSTYTEDISGYGIRIAIKRKLNIDEEVNLKIYLSSNPIECKGRVVWIKEKVNPMLEETFFDTGIEFKYISEETKDYINSCIVHLKDKR